jgi:hypothetical protein
VNHKQEEYSSALIQENLVIKYQDHLLQADRTYEKAGKRKDGWEDRRHERKPEKRNERFKGKRSSAVKYPGRKRIRK